LVAETVKDSHGAPAAPYRAVDTVEIMLRAGTITKDMANAAARFRQAFRITNMDPLRAADMARTRRTGGRPAERPTWARQLVTEVVLRLGGQGCLAASVVWYVVGLEIPISRWSTEHGEGPREAMGRAARK
jgi:hypothetical protein